MMNILIETISFSALVSFLTLGISAASFEGAVLYPLRLWVRNRYAKKWYDVVNRLEQYQKLRRSRRQASYWVDPAKELASIKLLYRIWWLKLLFLCSQCMPTLWSAVLYFTVFSGYPIWVWLLGWPISSFINLLISKHWL